MQTTTPKRDAVHGAARQVRGQNAHGSEADTHSPKGKPVVSRREGERNKSATVGAPRRRH